MKNLFDEVDISKLPKQFCNHMDEKVSILIYQCEYLESLLTQYDVEGINVKHDCVQLKESLGKLMFRISDTLCDLFYEDNRHFLWCKGEKDRDA